MKLFNLNHCCVAATWKSVTQEDAGLLAAQGMSNVEIATKLDMHRNAISNIRRAAVAPK